MDEQTLLNLLQENDPRGYEMLIEAYADMMYRVAYRILQNEQDAEDAVQESFINIYRHIEGFNGQSKLSTWIYRITSNTALDIVRRHKRKQGQDTALIDFGDEEDTYEPADENAPQPEEVLLQRESIETIQQALEAMPPKLREAYLLYMLDGLSTREIAETLAIKPSAAKVRVHRARQFLQNYLAAHQEK